MNKIYLAIMALLALASCTSLDDEFRLDDNQKQPSRYSEIQRYQVPLASARYFAQKLKLEDHAPRQIKSIEPIIKGQDTLMYFVNYEGDKGWVVLSGDKRTEAILASSTKGYLDKEVLGGSSLWFEDLAGKIYGLKHSKSKDTQSGDYAMWCKIDTLALGLHPNPNGQKPRSFIKEPGDAAYDNDERDYEDLLVDTQIEVLVDKVVGPLIPTKWGQSFPWNECTPFWQYSEQRCLTGCVAVAGAQMLYYFHYLKNKPRTFFSRGFCTGRVWDKHNRSYTFSFTDPREDVWERMATNIDYPGTDLVALLMGFVGDRINMDYGKDESGAKIENLVKLYQEFGIGSSYVDYDEGLVRTSLDHQLPVNISAYAERHRAKFIFINLWWIYDVGHAWIIDGYKDKRIRYTCTYERLPKFKKGDEDEIELRSLNSAEQDAMKSNKSPRLFRFQPTRRYTVEHTNVYYYWTMNFGWDGHGDNADYLTGGKSVWSAGGFDFEYKKRIIHNFSF